MKSLFITSYVLLHIYRSPTNELRNSSVTHLYSREPLGINDWCQVVQEARATIQFSQNVEPFLERPSILFIGAPKGIMVIMTRKVVSCIGVDDSSSSVGDIDYYL